MKKYIFCICVLLSNTINAEINKVEKYASVCKIWGFLKYYHPNIAKGEYQWDKELFVILNETENINSEKDFSDYFIDKIDKLGKVPAKSIDSSTQYFSNNFDNKWLKQTAYFSEELKKKLVHIEQYRNTSANRYVSYVYKNGNLEFTDDIQDTQVFFPEKNYRLWTLFSYWNKIHYFFPYKYQMDTSWNNTLEFFITKFIECKNLNDFHFVILELITRIDDSHGYFSSKITSSIWGNKYLPITYTYIDGKFIVTADSDRSVEDNLKKGDIILKINQQTPDEIIQKFNKYNPASNSLGKIRNVVRNSIPTRTNSDILNLVILRGKDTLEINPRVFRNKNKQKLNAKIDQDKIKLIQDSIAYINMGILERKDIDSIWDIVGNRKYIVFDIRNYPKNTMFNLSKKLFSQPRAFAHFIFPDINYPGMFKYKSPNYTEKSNLNIENKQIILLVNEQTQSHAEYTTMLLQAYPKAITIGRQSAGADGNVNILIVNGTQTYFTGLGVFYPYKGITQRKGVRIDIEVNPRMEDILMDRDVILEKAISYIYENN